MKISDKFVRSDVFAAVASTVRGQRPFLQLIEMFYSVYLVPDSGCVGSSVLMLREALFADAVRSYS